MKQETELKIKGSFEVFDNDNGGESIEFNEITDFGIAVIIESIARLTTRRWRKVRVVNSDGTSFVDKTPTYYTNDFNGLAISLKSEILLTAADYDFDIHQIQMVGGGFLESDQDVVASVDLSTPLPKDTSYTIIRNDQVYSV